MCITHYLFSSLLASSLWKFLHIFSSYHKEVNSHSPLKIFSGYNICIFNYSFLWYLFILEWKEASTQSRIWLWLEQTQWNTGEQTDLNAYSFFFLRKSLSKCKIWFPDMCLSTNTCIAYLLKFFTFVDLCMCSWMFFLLFLVLVLRYVFCFYKRGGRFEVAVSQQGGGLLVSPPTCPASPQQGGRQGDCGRDYTKWLRGLIKIISQYWVARPVKPVCNQFWKLK